jgi:hypothetical protein
MTTPAYFNVLAASRGEDPWSDTPPAVRHDPALCVAGHPDGAAFCGACGFVADEYTAPTFELNSERH